MIIQHQQFCSLGKKILEHAVFQAPLRESRTLQEEACFLYNVQGKLELYGATERIELNLRQGMVMRCGNYLANHLKTGSEPSEAIAVHFYPEVLKYIYKDNIPAMLIQDSVGTYHKNQVAKVEVDRMIENYIDGLLFYFNNTELINDELITLKLK